MPKKQKGGKPVDAENPEALPSAPANSLFGKKASKPQTAAAAGDAPAAKAKKRPAEIEKSEPGVHLIAEAKKRKREAAEGDNDKANKPGKPAAKKPDAFNHKGQPKPAAGAPAFSRADRPHSECVEASNKLWERLRAEKTGEAERATLVGEVLALFAGKTIEVLQKHDAARVLQSCFKQGTPAQRDTLMAEIKGQMKVLARSHYGHFLLVSIIRNGSAAHKQAIVAELRGHVAELLVHAEGSAVLQLLYADVATGAQRNEMYREMWGKEMALFEQASKLSNIDQLIAADPLVKDRVLRRLEILLSKAARKGLAATALVQRGAAELLKHGDATQRAELVAAFREQVVHIMHTRDGCRIACCCLRHGDAKDRKALLKAMKGYIARAALDPHGALVVATALEAVDDTVLLSKSVLAELCADLPQLAPHAHGALPLLQLLAPRSARYFTPAQLGLMGDPADSASKKDPAVRRAELLPTLLPALAKLAAADAVALACSPSGSSVLYETVRVAVAAEAGAPTADVTPALQALAAAALERTPGAAKGSPPLLSHAIAQRIIKRFVQEHAAFADTLLMRMAGALPKWAVEGAGWIVLALLEAGSTASAAAAEFNPSAVAAVGKSDAAGCKKLHLALSNGAAPAKPAVTKVTPAKATPATAKATPKGTPKATPKGTPKRAKA